MRVLHVTRRPTAGTDTPSIHQQLETETLMQIARGKHTDLQLVEAATVQTSDTELAYMLTNSIDEAWHQAQHPQVTPTGYSLRSTSINDVLVDGSVVLVFRRIGVARLSIAAADIQVGT